MLVVNFGAVELQTYLWLADLADDKDLPFRALKSKWKFKRRVDALIPLIKATVSDDSLQLRCAEAWDRALTIATRRNAIVHNPILFGWSTGKEVGPPDIIGVADVQHLVAAPRISERLASRVDIINLANDIAAVARELIALRDEYSNGRGENSNENVA